MTVEIFVFCGWWFSNHDQFDIVSETHFICDAVDRGLWLAILSSLLCPETDRNIRVGKQGYVLYFTDFKTRCFDVSFLTSISVSTVVFKIRSNSAVTLSAMLRASSTISLELAFSSELFLFFLSAGEIKIPVWRGERFFLLVVMWKLDVKTGATATRSLRHLTSHLSSTQKRRYKADFMEKFIHWNSRDLESTVFLKGLQYISFQSSW